MLHRTRAQKKVKSKGLAISVAILLQPLMEEYLL
jgi:hypothetical protein